MGFDLVTTAYRSAAAYSRAVPRPVADLTAKALSRAAATVSAERRMLVARHLRRARPELEGRALDRAVDATFDSYARYWIDSFRLPGLPAAEVDRHFGVEGFDHVTESVGRRPGHDHRPAPPRRVGVGRLLAHPGDGHAGHGGRRAGRAARAVRLLQRLPPPARHEHRARSGPSAAGEVLRALKANHVVCLLSDRDIIGDGVEVEFFGETTTLPAGPATLALRTGAAPPAGGLLLRGQPRPPRRRAAAAGGRARGPPAGRRRPGHRRPRRPPRGAHPGRPEQWHLQQPNWPSDYDALEAIGKPHPRPAVGPSAAPSADPVH